MQSKITAYHNHAYMSRCKSHRKCAEFKHFLSCLMSYLEEKVLNVVCFPFMVFLILCTWINDLCDGLMVYCYYMYCNFQTVGRNALSYSIIFLEKFKLWTCCCWFGGGKIVSSEIHGTCTSKSVVMQQVRCCLPESTWYR